MNDKVIGIIGGMGPEATADFFMKIIKGTKVEKDQDHFRVLIDSNVKIPDRTQAILHGGQSPLPMIIATANRLKDQGATIGCIPCMTSHYYIDEIRAGVSMQILSLFEALQAYIEANYGLGIKVGVLATSGTVEMGLFEKYLPSCEVIYPDAHIQEDKVMEAIYGVGGIKRGVLVGKPVGFLSEACESLADKGAKVLILGCTEIGLALKQQHVSIPLIDPLDVAVLSLTKE